MHRLTQKFGIVWKLQLATIISYDVKVSNSDLSDTIVWNDAMQKAFV